MTDHQYLIIGAMTAAAAADGIGEIDATGSIGIIGAETDAFYNSAPLITEPGSFAQENLRPAEPRPEKHEGY